MERGFGFFHCHLNKLDVLRIPGLKIYAHFEGETCSGSVPCVSQLSSERPANAGMTVSLCSSSTVPLDSSHRLMKRISVPKKSISHRKKLEIVQYAIKSVHMLVSC